MPDFIIEYPVDTKVTDQPSERFRWLVSAMVEASLNVPMLVYAHHDEGQVRTPKGLMWRDRVNVGMSPGCQHFAFSDRGIMFIDFARDT
jgi:hypothetical protein